MTIWYTLRFHWGEIILSAQSNHGSFSIIVVVLFVIIFYFLNLQFVPDRGTLGLVVARSPLWINLAANTDNFQPMMASTVTLLLRVTDFPLKVLKVKVHILHILHLMNLFQNSS